MRLLPTFLLIASTVQSGFALGHTAITTLKFPYGTEGNALGSSGVAFSNEPGSVFYNPANAALYGQRANVNFWESHSIEPLLPSLDFNDIFLKANEFGVFVPNLLGDFGLAMMYSSSNLEFGEVASYNEDGTLNGYSDGWEKVQNITVSPVWKEYVSLGFAIKPFHSKLSEDSQVKGVVLDVGLRGQYPKTFDKYFYIVPGIGFTLQNFGQESVKYSSAPDTAAAAPLPKTLLVGGSFELGVPNVVWLTVMQDQTLLLVNTKSGKYDRPMFNRGVQLGLTPLCQLNFGKLIDDEGDRYEDHFGVTLGYRHAQFMKFLNLVTSSNKFDSEKFNFHVVYSKSKIAAWGDNLIREDQISRQLTAGFGMNILSPKTIREKKSKEKENGSELKLTD